ncbi:hypothetical protein CHELA41_23139 [Hyphomicrobiales bacterium]|nr:hypothetical protein CHELA41_23139 [Hyphomicrobiales bacterium]
MSDPGAALPVEEPAASERFGSEALLSHIADVPDLFVASVAVCQQFVHKRFKTIRQAGVCWSGPGRD